MFAGGKTQGQQKPTALGTLLQSSCYGSVIPQHYGLVKAPLLAIWAANIRQGSSTKKLKNFFAAKKGADGYCENINFLIGHSPIMWVGQVWNNGVLWPLTLKTATFSRAPFTSIGFTIADLNFYSLIAVTMEVGYSVTFNDYGGNGSVSSSGSMNIPLWNMNEVGPDPTNPNSFRKWPYIYNWQPINGPIFSIPEILPGNLPPPGASWTNNVTVYYYAFPVGATTPLLANRLAFENELGSGPEYSGFTSQQIIYPMFAGAGSPDIDLGTTGSLPSLSVETKGKWGYYATGDADFADMIEDVIKSGISQASIGGASGTVYTGMSHGLQGYDYPGPVQKRRWEMFETVQNFQFPLPNTAGNILVAVIYTVGAGTTPPPATISDGVNTWVVGTSHTTFGTSVPGTWTLFYALNCAAGSPTIVINNQAFYHTSVQLYELAGVDSFDGLELVVGPNPTATLTTTNQAGFPGYVMVWSSQNNSGGAAATPYTQRWKDLVPQETFTGQFIYYAQWKSTSQGGVQTQSWYNNPANSNDSFICMLAFKSTTPSSVSATVGNFVDDASLNLVRTQCQAYGLYGALAMLSQQSATDWLKSFYRSANAAPVYYGWKLYSIPYAEASAVGNGVVYVSPTASGPVAALSDLNGDFVKNGVTIATVDRSGQDNVLQMQCYSRASNYNQVTISQPAAVGITLFGTRKADPVSVSEVQDPNVGRSLLGIMVRKNQFGGDVYSFTMLGKWDWLTPMDLITVTDTLAGIFSVPVRLTSMQEQGDGSWGCEAEPFVYGMLSPTALTTLAPTPTGQNNPNQSAGNANAPVFIEPPVRLTASGQPELWLGISSSSTLYGGSQVLISTDGGTSYQSLGNTNGSAITGVSTADWPISTDPDTTNNLALDLTESIGILDDYTAAERDSFSFLSYIAGGGASPIPYELLAYNTATLTATSKYTLQATGGGNGLRRAVYNCPTTGTGVDHPISSRFLFLNPTSQGILKVLLPSNWIGVALKFKIVTFNTQGGGLQDPSTVTIYTYTPTGVALGSSASNLTYTQTPLQSLTQPTSTTIHMATTTTTFPSNQAVYNARTFTISAPSVATWYYVTVKDTAFIGDTGSTTNLTATCQTSSALVGVVGNTFIGAILALPAGGATTISAGGYPPQQLFTVNGA